MTRSQFSAGYERFRELLIAAREDAGFTQQQVAERLKRPQSFVSKYERGERRLDVVELIEIATALGTEASSIVDSLQKHLRRERRSR